MKRSKQQSRPGTRARVLVVVTLGAVLVAQGIALADPEPMLEDHFPLPNGTVRSIDADAIWARFDRTLSDEGSDFRLFDKNNVEVDGEDYLSEPPSHLPGGLRQINFHPFAPLTESLSPYRAEVIARAAVTLDDADLTWLFSIDDTAPGNPSVTDPLNGQVRTDQPLAVRGTGEPGARVFVVENTELIAEDVVASTGQFFIVLPYPPEDGVYHTFTVYQQDPAGNTSPGGAPITIYHDSIVQIPIILTPKEGQFLNTTTVTVSGTAKPNSSVRVREGPIIGVTPANAAGDWSIDLVFANGPHSITAESWDGVMLDGPSGARAFTVDVNNPPAPVIVTPAPGQQLDDPAVTISGTAEPLGTVRIRHLGIIRANAPVDGAGSWSTVLTFAEGSHTIEAWTVDRAGNAGVSAFRTFGVDTVAPAAPVITSPAQGAFLNTNNVTIAGDAEPFASVDVVVGTVVVGTGIANGAGSWTANVFFPDGAHTVTAVAVDAAGNRSPHSAPRSFTVDTVAPSAPVIEEPEESSTQTTDPVVVSGTGEPAATIEVREGFIVVGTTQADGEGNWTVEISFANGVHSITARAIDHAANVSPASAVRTFTVNVSVDVVAPTPPILVDPAAASIQPGRVIFRGTAEPGSTVRIYEGASVIAHGSAPAGIFELAATLPTGPHTVTATATDAAGNASAPTPPRSFTVDATRPGISIDTANGSIFLPLLQTVLIEGTASDNTAVVLVEIEVRDLLGRLVLTETASVCTGCPGPLVVWKDEPDLLAGIYDVTASAVDLVGNRSIPATIQIIV